MKIKPECIPCIFERACYECNLAFTEERKKMDVLSELLRFISANLDNDTVPAFIGTARDRIIKKHSGRDPYEDLKRKSNEVAMRLLGDAKEFYLSNDKNKMELLLRIAAAANSMEYGIRGHLYDHETFHETFKSTLRENLIGNITGIEHAIESHAKILYLTDNAGEIVFDAFVIEELVKRGKDVVVSPRSNPVMNDATVNNLDEIGYKYKHSVMPNGSYVGISLEGASEEFLDLFWDAEYLVLAKGMGNYETISEFDDELRSRLIYVLMAKCESVASDIGVKKGELVAKLI
jgi:hypothetical protein